MNTSKQHTANYHLLNVLEEWDKGVKSVRANILKDFIAQNENKTASQLEAQFSQAASLFLTRLTAWLRTSYMLANHLDLLLKAINIFLTSSSGHNFLVEVIEVGGIMTFLEVLNLKQAKEEHKYYALVCLQSVAAAGRKYKELICESFGIRAVAECLAKSKSESTQAECRTVLLLLSDGNPKYQQQVYRGLIALLLSNQPKAQQMTCQSLRTIQPKIKVANPVIVDPLLALLQTIHLEVQYEAIELIKDLITYPDVRHNMLSGLVELLKPTREQIFWKQDDGEVEQLNAPLPVFIQQAASAKTIGLLARVYSTAEQSACEKFTGVPPSAEHSDVGEELVQLRVVHSLMYAMGNQDHADSQRQASMTLDFFCRTFPVVDLQVKEAMGEALYNLFVSNPETLYTRLTNIQADILISNKVPVPDVQLYKT